MNRSHAKLLLAAVAVQALTAGTAYAQDEPADASGDIVVTARRVSENLQNIPIAISAFSAETLRETNVTTPMDLQLITPGVQTTQSVGDATNVKFKIRGQSSASGFLESSVGVYVDGVYLQLQNGLNAAMFDLERVEVLKGPQGTLYGKNTTGGVVNIITKKPDLDEFGGYLKAGVGTFADDGASGIAATAEAAINVPLVPGTLAARVSALYDYSEGYGHDGLDRNLNNRNDPYIRAHILYQPDADITILLSADHGKMKGRGASQPNAEANASSLATAIGTAAGAAPADRTAVGIAFLRADIDDGRYYDMHTTTRTESYLRQTNASLTFDAKVTDSFSFRSITAYRKLYRFGVADTSGAPFDHIFQTSTSDRTEFFSQEFDLIGTAFNDLLDWQTGTYYSVFKNRYGSVPGIGLQQFRTSYQFQRGRKKSISTGAFVQGVWHLTDGLDVTTGIRYSHDYRRAQDQTGIFTDFNFTTLLRCANPSNNIANGCLGKTEKFGKGAVTYELSASYKLTDAVMGYVAHRRGFRAGDFNTVGGRSIKFLPEYVKDYEVGIKSTWFDNRFLFNVAAYHTDYKDVQKSQNVIVPGTPPTVTNTVTNAASATVEGVEVESRFRVTDRFNLGVNYTYTHPKYDEWLEPIVVGGVITGFKDRSREAWEIAEHVFSLYGNYSIPLDSGDEIKLNATYYYQSGAVVLSTAADIFKNDPTLWQSGYGLIGARLTYSFSDLDMDVSLFGTNLGGKQYLIGGSCSRSIGRCFVQPGEPRFVGLEITKRL